MKKVLLVSQFFYPENFKCNDIAFELVRRGYQVDVLTNIPNYPEGHYYRGYGLFKRRKEVVNGVRIFRSLVIPRRKGGLFRILNYFSFMLFASIDAFFLALTNRYDCVFVMQLSPIMQAYPGIWVKKMQRIPLYMWILDIWPDSMISGGGIRNKTVIGLIDGMVKSIYRNCDRLLISSKGFRELVLQKESDSSKVIYFPNWADDLLNMPVLDVPVLPKGFRIMMAGTLGEAQRLESVVHLMEMLDDLDEIKWIFVGDGKKKAWLEQQVLEHHWEEKVVLTGRYPSEYMPAFFKEADAMLLTLKAEWPHLRAVVPGRVQSYMAASKPIVGMVEGGSAELIEEADCGWVVPADHYQELADIIRKEVVGNAEMCRQKGLNGRNYYEQRFTSKLCMDHLEKILNGGL